MVSRRQQKLDMVVEHLQQRYGPQAAQRGKELTREARHRAGAWPSVSTTFPELDTALAGGVPCGRITEIIGSATSGKTTLAAKIAAAAHRDGDSLVAWLDLSRTVDADYLRRCGLDLGRLLIVHPETAADGMAIAAHLVESGALAAIVVDGMVNPADPLMGGGMSGAADELERIIGTLERLATVIANTQTALVFLSEPHVQLRTLAHIATLRLGIRRDEWIVRHGDVRGYAGHVEILKNKLGRAGDQAPLQITFDGTVQGETF